MNKQQFKQVTEWQFETFGEATALSKIEHLKEEIEELKTDLINNGQGVGLEFADCFLLLYGAAAANGMSYKDICTAIDVKMAINFTREWGKPDKNGVVKHISAQ